MMTTPSHFQACLIQDVCELLLNAPHLVMRYPTSSIWGLAPVPIGSSFWYAMSIEGCARVAVRKRPWIYAEGVPDLKELADALASRFKHAEPKGQVGQYLFTLGEQFGPCGRLCLLAHATEENFPWILSSAKPVPSAAECLMDPQEWRENCSLAKRDQELLVHGGSLPGAPDLSTFLTPCLIGIEPETLLVLAVRERLKASLLDAIERERMRLDVLARCWSAGSPHPYAIPEWMDDPSNENAIESLLDGCVAEYLDSRPEPRRETTGPVAEDPVLAPRPRRPTAVPHIQLVRPLGAPGLGGGMPGPGI